MKKIIVILLVLFTMQIANVNAQTLTANDVSIKVSGNSQWPGTLKIGLNDAEDCTAVAFRISFPANIGGSDISMSMDMTHSLYTYGDKYMFLTDDNTAFANIMKLMGQSISASFDASGIYIGQITDIELVTKDFKLITLPDVSFTITVDNDTNAIDVTSPDSNGDEQIYSVSGIIQDELMEGVNIIRKADGTTMKVLK